MSRRRVRCTRSVAWLMAVRRRRVSKSSTLFGPMAHLTLPGDRAQVIEQYRNRSLYWGVNEIDSGRSPLPPGSGRLAEGGSADAPGDAALRGAFAGAGLPGRHAAAAAARTRRAVLDPRVFADRYQCRLPARPVQPR